ncbi:Crp/Fnr family transcriptional regulator [Fodinibius salsisoli]|uniref:Crp/Fnr family transcriptional regulator n=1 Tax=Fodinibius salsisoli TaxID=2820877 RepID=A0ABT3PPS9_9BACT|nr:Crp/Fnr family transcriptional regulator [Fodinibius salsisoli]MCW9707863.1 Crp/Fnr family transcriptional regulator [Fodinibius salsisoli]
MPKPEKLLSDRLNKIINFDEPSLSELMNLFEVNHFDKGFHYAKTGEYATRMGFVVEGVLRAYHTTKEGEYYNKTFFTEGSFVGAYSSLVTGKKNLINIQCLTDVMLLEGSYADLVALYDDYPSVERFSRILAEQYFVHKERREIQLVTLDAAERYELFRKNHPEVEQQIPQYHIASYLGVTPTQLSRIRAKQ